LTLLNLNQNQMQGKVIKAVKKHASTPKYVSPNQLILAGFETPFDQQLTRENRWVKMAKAIPWDSIVVHYDRLFTSTEGRPPISGRVILGALMIKHIENLSDRATILHIQENMFMQYFLGYTSFTNDEPFSDTLFVEIRKRLSLDLLSKINEVIALHCLQNTEDASKDRQHNEPPHNTPASIGSSSSLLKGASTNQPESSDEQSVAHAVTASISHKGKLITDATAAPQNITYPTDLKLLNAAREKSEALIDMLWNPLVHGNTKPRTYREVARKLFLNTARKKQKNNKAIYKSNGQQLRFLRRNLAHIETLLAACPVFPLKPKDQKYLMVLHTVYEQQEQMHRTHTNRIEHRIVNIHQPHVRPIVRGKEKAKVEFGSKLQVSIVNGFTFIDHLSWDAFNEGQYLQTSVEYYKRRLGYYPKEVLADQIYCTRENRKLLKEKGIHLVAKPLGRPSAKAVAVHLSPGERNPIEGKFGQAKTAYGLDNIKAKLKQTSESWIAMIALVLNLVNLTRQALVSLLYYYRFFVRIFYKSEGQNYKSIKLSC
jgi:transposase, IS5 family